MQLVLHNAKNLKFKQDLLWVGVSTLATIIIWIIYSIYVAFTTPTTDNEINKLLTPINPILDKETLSQLEDVYYPPETYTILVKQEVGESSRVVPLGTEVPEDLETELTEVSTLDSSTDTTTPTSTTPTPAPTTANQVPQTP